MLIKLLALLLTAKVNFAVYQRIGLFGSAKQWKKKKLWYLEQWVSELYFFPTVANVDKGV